MVQGPQEEKAFILHRGPGRRGSSGGDCVLCVYTLVKGILRETRKGECWGGETGLERRYRIKDSSHPQGRPDGGVGRNLILEF